MQSPEIYLNDLGISVPCVVDTTRLARLEVNFRVFVNWETFYLNEDTALAAFRADPSSYTGLVTDPVTRMKFQPTPDSPRMDHRERVFLFSSDETAATFASTPDSFATPIVPMAARPPEEPDPTAAIPSEG